MNKASRTPSTISRKWPPTSNMKIVDQKKRYENYKVLSTLLKTADTLVNSAATFMSVIL